MNNKGFTLIELLAVIILLALITSVTAVSIVGIINNSKEKSHELLIKNIKIAAQEYFEECDNVEIINTDITCPTINTSSTASENLRYAQFTLEKLLTYGFLSSSAIEKDVNGNETKIVKDPINNKNIGVCTIEIVKSINKTTANVTYEINTVGSNSICPTKTEYDRG